MSSRRTRLFLSKETLRNLPADALARAAGGTEYSYNMACPTVNGCETEYNCESAIPCPIQIVGRKSLAYACSR